MGACFREPKSSQGDQGDCRSGKKRVRLCARVRLRPGRRGDRPQHFAIRLQNKYGQAKRAKFSTLTDDEIKESFANLIEPNAGLAEAGRSRHLLDFIYGVNLSRALVKSFKTTNRYRNLSIGRVQGPTLAFAADRELEIRMHVPDPYWTIS